MMPHSHVHKHLHNIMHNIILAVFHSALELKLNHEYFMLSYAIVDTKHSLYVLSAVNGIKWSVSNIAIS